MFTLSTGSFRHIEEQFLADFAARRAGEPLASLLVLSPSGRLLTHLQQRLAAQGPGYLNITFLTFYALAERLLEDAGYAEPVVTEPALYHEIIRNLLEGRGEIPFESRRALAREGAPLLSGLPAALADTLKDLRDSGARIVDSLHAALEGHLGQSAPEAVPALELYARLYQTLEKHGLRTPADLLRRATERAPAHAFIRGQKTIFLYGFYDLTGIQLDLVLSLAKHPDARVYFPYEEGNPAFAYALKLLKDPAFAGKCGGNVGAGLVPARTVIQLESNISSRAGTRPAPTVPAAQISVWSCSGARDEAWIAAKKIQELADAGTPWEEILVTTRSLSSYAEILREILTAHRIPFYLDAKEPIGAYPLVKTAWKALMEEPDRTIASWSAHGEWAKLRLAAALPESAEASERDHRLREAVLDAAEALVGLDALKEDVSRAHFLELLGEKLERLTIPFAAGAQAGVQVLDVMSARGLRFDSVILLGMNEKSFPRLIREDPFLSDQARGALAEALGCRLARKMDGYAEERMLFELIREAAVKTLHVSFQRSDEEGKALIPSLYLQALGVTPKDYHHLPRPAVQKWGQFKPEQLTPKELSVLLNRNHVTPLDLYQALKWDVPLYKNLLSGLETLESMKPLLGERDGSIGGNRPILAAIHKRGYSPDALKRLSDCPFRYFSGKILELNEDAAISQDEGDLPVDMEGRIIHRILELHYREPMDLDRACDQAFREAKRETISLYPLVWTATQARIRQRVRNFSSKDNEDNIQNNFTPSYFELEISGDPGASDSPIQGVGFHGRIDRIDLREEGGKTHFRVIDYKTGRPTSEASGKTDTAVLKGRYPQLPIYLKLAEGWLKDKLKKPVEADGAWFYNLADWEEGRESPSLSPDFWQTHGRLYAENLAGWLELVQHGTFFIRPSGERGPCSWCGYAMICRKEHKPSAFRSEHSRDRQRLEEMLKRKPE